MINNLYSLEELCLFIRNGKSIPQSKDLNGIPITRIETIANQTIDINRVGYAGLNAEEIKNYLLQDGDILFSHINSLDHLCKTALYTGYPTKIVHGMNLLCLRPNTDLVLPKYLLYLLRFKRVKTELLKYANKSVNQASISAGNLKSFTVSVPSLGVQRRIAAILDQADALRQKRQQSLEKLDQLLQAAFIEMFGDPVSNPKGWKLSTLGTECDIGTGSTPSRKNNSFFEGDIPWVKSTEVNWGIISKTGEQITEEAKNSSRLKLHPKGSIILALYGQGITRGKCAILGLDATLNQACAGLAPKAGLNNYFLFSFLRFSYFNLRNQARGGNQENLNLSIVKDFPIYLPPLEMQIQWHKFALSLENQHKVLSDSLNVFEILFNSLQQKAFTGRL